MTVTIDRLASTTIFPSQAKAEEAAAQLRAEDQEWEYLVDVDPNGSGRALVKVYDEAGEFLHNL